MDELRSRLIAGTLSSEHRLLLSELAVKHALLQRQATLPSEDDDVLKYAFLGAYIYGLLGDGPLTMAGVVNEDDSGRLS